MKKYRRKETESIFQLRHRAENEKVTVLTKYIFINAKRSMHILAEIIIKYLIN